MAVSRAILRDEKRYRDPDAFNPSRFLTSDGKLDDSVPDPTETFGFSRRICAGRFFAEDFLFITMANILAAFTIEKPRDAFGQAITPRAEFTTGMLR